MPPQPPHWQLCNPSSVLASALAAAISCPAPIASLLVARGYATPDAARHFLNPSSDDLLDPLLMLGMQAAVARIEGAIRTGEKILVYGDYDVDGTVATVLLKTAIERVARSTGAPVAQVAYHVPHRLREGYGIQNVRLAEAAADGISLVISVDTGIRAFAASDEARALSLDLIVTDHHLPDGITGIPDAVAVINPAQPGCPYPNKNLCGAGVAFQLAHALLRSAAQSSADPESQQKHLETVLLPSFLKLVAIATVADSVSLTGENRALVALGLRNLANPVQPGLRALLQVAEIALDRPPSASEVGFRIAPRINAAGRMDVASDVVELFLTRDSHKARDLAQKLDSLNQDRRATEAAALAAIELQLLTMRTQDGLFPPECLVLGHPSWHRGVLGILASRVVERTGRPALILTEEDGHAHGSGRSIEGFHLLDALTAVHLHNPAEDLFTRFGGHAHAVGFSLPVHRLPELQSRMRTHSATILTGDLLSPTLSCDLELSPSEISPELLPWLELCAPFGMANPEPVFVSRGLLLAGAPRIIKDRHICLPVLPPGAQPGSRPINAMGWTRSTTDDLGSWAARCGALIPGTPLDLAFHLRENKHPIHGGLELNLLDLKHSTNPAPMPSMNK